MAKSENWCTETPFQLFNAAESDIHILNSYIKDKEVPDNWKHENICFHATQSVEKFIKGFIKYNNQKVLKSHDLEYICGEAINIDKIFNNIKKDCNKLNNYTASVRYDSNIPIEQHEITEILKLMKKIYAFEPIQNLRNKLSKQKGYKLLPTTTDTENHIKSKTDNKNSAEKGD